MVTGEELLSGAVKEEGSELSVLLAEPMIRTSFVSASVLIRESYRAQLSQVEIHSIGQCGFICVCVCVWREHVYT